MKEEITARFKCAAEKNISSSDLYRGLLMVDGITVDMVRKYMDDDTADRMKEFCVNNGLL